MPPRRAQPAGAGPERRREHVVLGQAGAGLLLPRPPGYDRVTGWSLKVAAFSDLAPAAYHPSRSRHGR